MNRDDHKAILMSSYRQLTKELNELEGMSKEFLAAVNIKDGEVPPDINEMLHRLVSYQAHTAAVVVALTTMVIAHLNLDNLLKQDVTIQ